MDGCSGIIQIVDNQRRISSDGKVISAGTQGTRVVARVAAVLKVIRQMMSDGAGTSEIAETIGLTWPTAHRLLASLSGQGLVDRYRHSGRWLLGPEICLMGTVTAKHCDVSRTVEEHVEALAQETDESAFFSTKRGDQTVCLLRKDGSSPVRSFMLYGVRQFPLGAASAGLDLPSFMPVQAVDRYPSRTDLVPECGPQHSVQEIRERMERTRRRGYVVNPGLLVEGSWGLGLWYS